jgi:PAS domain-containing protein
MAAALTLTVDGRVEGATSEALELLGVTLAELQSLPSGAFSPEPPDPEADGAFRERWDAEGRPDVGGNATLQRLDGTRIRVRFVIRAIGGDRVAAVLEPVEVSTDAPPAVYTAGEVLREWRAAERRLEALSPDSSDWALAAAEIEELRGRYQQVFQRLAG